MNKIEKNEKKKWKNIYKKSHKIWKYLKKSQKISKYLKISQNISNLLEKRKKQEKNKK